MFEFRFDKNVPVFCAVVSLLLISGCSLSIETGSSRDAKSPATTSAQSEKLEKLEEQVAELKALEKKRKAEDEERIAELEKQIFNLENDGDEPDSGISDGQIEVVKIVYEAVGVMPDNPGFKYVEVDKTAAELGAFLSFEDNDGGTGIVLMAESERWVDRFFSVVLDECSSVFAGDPDTWSSAGFEFKARTDLCLSDQYYPWVFHHHIVTDPETDGVVMIIQEWLKITLDDDLVLDVFVDGYKNVRPRYY